MKSYNIAIVGFANNPETGNRLLAAQFAQAAALRHWSITAGNTRGTMAVGLEHAKNLNAETTVVIERNHPIINGRSITNVIYADDHSQKHEIIAQISDAALVIGGGYGSLRLVNALLLYKKPVFALRGSGGITKNELPEQVTLCSRAVEAAATIDRHLISTEASPLVSQL